jgi:coproporphyrinogen III oxidase-like Fe-S oxidoreductase
MDATSVVSAFDGPVGAYLHVPFCEWICPFCPYNKVLAEPSLAERYFAALHREVDAYVAAFRAAGGTAFSSLYVGGGTPTLYPDHLAELLERIPVSGERAIEVLPSHGTVERLDRLAAIGFTAVSIGAQSFHDAVLRRLHRPHDAATSRAAVGNALGRFDCVDVDLIVDVEWEREGECRGAFLDDVRACFELEVDQVSTYPLMRFGYTPFGTARHDRRLEHRVLSRATGLADAAGYQRRSVWTFNRRGAVPYTSITRRRFLGMGAGSSSFAGRDFFVNHFGVGTYVDAVEAGRLPVARWLHLGRWAGAGYDAFWQAYAGGVDIGTLRASYGPAVAGAVRAGLLPLLPVGLLRTAPDGYRLTPRGFDAYHDLERAVTYQLIEPLWAQMLREHDAERGCGRAAWASPDQARRAGAWNVASRVFERPVRTGGAVP